MGTGGTGLKAGRVQSHNGTNTGKSKSVSPAAARARPCLLPLASSRRAVPCLPLVFASSAPLLRPLSAGRNPSSLRQSPQTSSAWPPAPPSMPRPPSLPSPASSWQFPPPSLRPLFSPCLPLSLSRAAPSGGAAGCWRPPPPSPHAAAPGTLPWHAPSAPPSHLPPCHVSLAPARNASQRSTPRAQSTTSFSSPPSLPCGAGGRQAPGSRRHRRRWPSGPPPRHPELAGDTGRHAPPLPPRPAARRAGARALWP